MAVHVSHASLPYPIKNARYSFLVPFLDADGDPTDPTTPDTELSQDNGTFADAAEEVSTASGSNGVGLITLTGAETNNSAVAAAFKIASGPKATLMTIYPRNLAVVGSGTLSAGSAGGGTLGTVLGYDVAGCFIRTTGGTGGGGTGGANNQARRMITYTPSTGAFTVSPNWETTPSTDTTYDVLLPEGVTLGMLKALNPTTAGRTLDVTSTGEAGIDWSNVGAPTTTLNLSGTTVKTLTDAPADSSGVTTLLSRLPAGLFTGLTNFAHWLGAIAGKQAANATAQTEIRASGAGSGTYDPTTDSNEALRDNTGTAGAGLTAVGDTSGTTTLLSRLSSTRAGYLDNLSAGAVALASSLTTLAGKFTGITLLAEWLGLLAGKQVGNTTARTELRATGAGSGTFDETTDSLEAMQDDSANLRDFGIMQVTTIATLASQVGFTLTNGSPDNDAYNGGVIMVTDQTTEEQKAYGIVDDYTGSTKTIALKWDPAIFTMAVGDHVTIKMPSVAPGVKRGKALASFEFVMIDSSDDITGKTGVTVTAERSIDGAAFAACSNSVTEVANGVYKISLSATDLAGNVITLKFTGTGCNATLITLVTEP